MKKIILVALLTSTVTHIATADPAKDRKDFQNYFLQKFPEVKLEKFSDGFISLPGMEDYAAQRDQDIPPYEFTVEEGKKLWNTPFPNGRTFAGCFKNGGRNIAQHYPYFDKKTQKVRTAEMDLLDCMKRNDPPLAEKFSNLKNEAVRVRFAGLVAAFYSLSKGQKVRIDLSSPGAKAAFEAGKKFWWTRRGQYDFSCASCHVQIAGQNIGGGQPVSAGLGHPLGWPAYRGKWERLDIIHHRYRSCNEEGRSKPFDYLSETYNNLQFYETYMSSGLPLAAPSDRGY